MATWNIIPRYAEQDKCVSHVHPIFACDVQLQGASGWPQLLKMESDWEGREIPQEETIVFRTGNGTESPEIMNATLSSKLLIMSAVDKGWLLTSTFYFYFLIVTFSKKHTAPLIWKEKYCILNHIILLQHQLFSSLRLESKLRKNLKFRASQITGLASWNLTIYSKVISMPLATISENKKQTNKKRFNDFYKPHQIICRRWDTNYKWINQYVSSGLLRAFPGSIF